MFIKIDDWLFDKIFQPISDWSTDRYVRGPHWIAAVLGYFLSASCIAAFFIIQGTARGLTYVMLTVFFFFTAWDNDETDKELVRSQTPTLNEGRVSRFALALRMAFLLLILNVIAAASIDVFGAFFIVLLIQTVLYTCTLYFEACETKPPAPPKEKEETSTRLARSTR